MDLIEFRRYLHKNPELGLQEYNTQKILLEALQPLKNAEVLKLGGTGLGVHFKSNESGPKLLIRGDMDALPIVEINDFQYKSQVEGVSHKCGHDGHTAILLGLAFKLEKEPINKGEVMLIFQPSEENGKGAQAILDDDKFNFEADRVYALHNLPGFPLHTIVCKKGSFTAAAKSVIIKLRGKTAHAAEPEKGINPGLAIASILQLSQELSNNDIKRKDFKLISMVHLNMGEKAYGISAGYGELHLTLRTWTNDIMDALEKDLVKGVEKITKREKLKYELEWLEIFHANENDHAAVAKIERAAQKLKLSYIDKKEAFKWGEDFGLFTSEFKGAMFGVGAGENSPALHNPDYDFPDEIIETGIAMFHCIIKEETD